MILIWTALIAAQLISQAQTTTGYHTTPDQWNGPRVYHRAFDENAWGDRIEVGTATESTGEKTPSPNGAYWFVFEEATPAEPHGNVRRLKIHNERDDLIEIALHGLDPRYSPPPRWLNEKLIHMRVAWGRIVGFEFIFDVEAGAFIYRETWHDGTIDYQQWQQQR